MPRKWSKAVPEGNGLVPHEEVGSDQPTMADLFKELFDKPDRKLDALTEKMRATR